MQKIITHNLSVEYANSGPGCYDFDQNGILFAQNRDILVTRNKMSQAYIHFLISCGFDIQNIEYVYADKGTSSSRNFLFEDPEILQKIISLISGKDLSELSLDTFMVTSDEEFFAKKIGLEIGVKSSQYHSFDNKSAFRLLAKKYKFKIAKGFENQTNALDLTLKAAYLFFTGFSEIIIKQNEGVAGLGSKRITKSEFLADISCVQNFVNQSDKNGVIPEKSKNFVIEGWYNNVVSSPSVQLFIDLKGNVEYISSHVQIFYPNKIRYKGCFSSDWLSETLKQELREKGIALAKKCAEEGYRGHIGFNTIVLDDESLLWVELNARRVMSSYPFQIKERLFGKSAESTPYMSLQVEKKEWEGKGVEDVLEALKPLLFSKENKRGFVPFDCRFLKTNGRLFLVGFGKNKEEVEKIFNYVNSI